MFLAEQLDILLGCGDIAITDVPEVTLNSITSDHQSHRRSPQQATLHWRHTFPDTISLPCKNLTLLLTDPTHNGCGGLV